MPFYQVFSGTWCPAVERLLLSRCISVSLYASLYQRPPYSIGLPFLLIFSLSTAICSCLLTQVTHPCCACCPPFFPIRVGDSPSFRCTTMTHHVTTGFYTDRLCGLTTHTKAGDLPLLCHTRLEPSYRARRARTRCSSPPGPRGDLSVARLFGLQPSLSFFESTNPLHYTSR